MLRCKYTKYLYVLQRRVLKNWANYSGPIMRNVKYFWFVLLQVFLRNDFPPANRHCVPATVCGTMDAKMYSHTKQPSSCTNIFVKSAPQFENLGDYFSPVCTVSGLGVLRSTLVPNATTSGHAASRPTCAVEWSIRFLCCVYRSLCGTYRRDRSRHATFARVPIIFLALNDG